MRTELKMNQSKKKQKIIWKVEQWDNINGANIYYLLTDLKGNYISKNINYKEIKKLYI